MNRGDLRMIVKTDYDGAIADFSSVIRIDPKYPGIYLHRGRAHFRRGDFSLAAIDFARSRNLADLADKPFATTISTIWSFISSARGGAEIDINRAENGRVVGSRIWPYPILLLFQQTASPADVLAAAVNAGERGARERTCQADFYIGEWQLLRGAKAEAITSFKKAVSECPSYLFEGGDAAAELVRLAS